jgi:hypothetical protein
MLKKRIGNTYVALSLLLVWILAVIGSALTIPRIIGQFSWDDSYEESKIYETTTGIPMLRLNDLGWDNSEYEGVDLRLRGHEDSDYMLIIKKEALGSSQQDAREHADEVTYTVSRAGDDFLFDSRIEFKDGAQFRFQNVEATFYIPYGQKFTMDEDLDEILVNTLHLNGYHAYQIEDNTWSFDEDGIRCHTCAATPHHGSYELNRDSRTYEFSNFDEVKISSAFKVKIYQDDEFLVKLSGSRGDMDQVVMQQSDGRLIIRHEDEDEWSNSSRNVTVSIYMPVLNYFRASGECHGDIMDFRVDEMEIDLSGETNFEIDVETDVLDVDLSGAAEMVIRGEAQILYVDMSGATELKSTDLEADEVTISASGNSEAKIFADNKLEATSSGDSRIYYSGTSNASLITTENGRIERD